jgi:hypothetical protein
MRGHLALLQWACQQGCPWDGEIFEFAAESGSVPLMQWLRQQGCPWDKEDCIRTAIEYCENERAGLKLAAWIRAQGEESE